MVWERDKNIWMWVAVAVQSLSPIWVFATPWTVAHQTSLYFTISQSLLKLMSIKLVRLSSHLILCRPLLLLPSSSPPDLSLSQHQGRFQWVNSLIKCSKWSKYWSFSFRISPSNEYSGLISLGLTGWISLLSNGISRVFSNTIVQKHQFFSTQLL